jgi:hypothetical protein
MRTLSVILLRAVEGVEGVTALVVVMRNAMEEEDDSCKRRRRRLGVVVIKYCSLIGG